MSTYTEIKSFWEESGEQLHDKDGLRPTARDPFMQELIEKHIINFLDGEIYVADIGCGEGSSTKKFSKYVKKISAIDYSSNFIALAKKHNAMPNVDYVVDDVLSLDSLAENSIDLALSIRCLINLPTEVMQYQGLENIFSKLKSGGLLLLCEGYSDGWDGLNDARARFSLPELVLAEYNLLLKSKSLNKELKNYGDILQFINFGEYLFGSRVVHPLLTDNKPKHTNKINKIYADIQYANSNKNYRECSYTGIYVIRKY